jgi:hypothetical protein
MPERDRITASEIIARLRGDPWFREVDRFHIDMLMQGQSIVRLNDPTQNCWLDVPDDSPLPEIQTEQVQLSPTEIQVVRHAVQIAEQVPPSFFDFGRLNAEAAAIDIDRQMVEAFHVDAMAAAGSITLNRVLAVRDLLVRDLGETPEARQRILRERRHARQEYERAVGELAAPHVDGSGRPGHTEPLFGRGPHERNDANTNEFMGRVGEAADKARRTLNFAPHFFSLKRQDYSYAHPNASHNAERNRGEDMPNSTWFGLWADELRDGPDPQGALYHTTVAGVLNQQAVTASDTPEE